MLIAAIFVAVSYFVQENIETLKSYMSNFSFFWGALIYVLLAFITTVIAPLTSVPLMPIAANLWGWQITGVLSILSWSLGSFVAFLIAVKFGKPVVKRFISLEKLEKYESKMPKENIFWTIVFLRMLIPVDILSYALGTFTKVNLKVYMSATILGITPFAFILSYVGMVSLKQQIILFIVVSFLASVILFLKYKTKKD